MVWSQSFSESFGGKDSVGVDEDNWSEGIVLLLSCGCSKRSANEAAGSPATEAYVVRYVAGRRESRRPFSAAVRVPR